MAWNEAGELRKIHRIAEDVNDTWGFQPAHVPGSAKSHEQQQSLNKSKRSSISP